MSERHRVGQAMKNEMPPIYVVLSTFEGAAHVREQVESIFAQSYSNWRLLLRDDGSTDQTVDRLEELAAEDSRLEIVRDDHGHLGGDRSFSLLMESALSRGADWIALSDQDDVWTSKKLECQIARLGESISRPGDCILLHSDLVVVGPDLDVIHASLHGSMRLNHETDSPLATLLVQNFVTGCTCVVSRGLLERALPIPKEAVVYDWWLALCAASYGQILFDADRYVLYRQHSRNQIGVKPYRQTLINLLARTLTPWRASANEFLSTVYQAQALGRHLAGRLSDSACSSVEDRLDRDFLEKANGFVSAYLSVYSMGTGGVRRVREVARLGVRRQDPILNALLKLKLLLTSIEIPRGSEEGEPGDTIFR
jgi:rhamnosyltransferase